MNLKLEYVVRREADYRFRLSFKTSTEKVSRERDNYGRV